MKEMTAGGVARLVAARADAIVAVSDAIADEARALGPRGPVVTIANGCDFDDFAGLEHHPSERFRITHAGSFFGKRDPKPFLRALAESGLEDVVVRFVGDFRAADRDFAESLGVTDRIELIGYVTRRRSLELQRDSDALLLLIPEAGGRGRGVLSGKVFEYLAAERPILAAVPPDGAAAQLVRDAGAGVVAAPDDVRRAPGRAPRPPRPLARGEARGHTAVAGVARPALAQPPRRGARRAAEEPRVSAVAVSVPASAVRARERVLDTLLFSVLFTATFEKVHWNFGGQVGIADVLTILFLVAYVLLERRPLPRSSAMVLGFFAAFLLVYLAGFFDLETTQGLDQFVKGMVKFLIHFLFLVAAIGYLAQRGERFYWRALDVVRGRLRRQRGLRRPAAARGARRPQPRPDRALAAHRRRQLDQHLRRGQRRERLPAERAHGRPEPPRRDARRAAARADARLPAPAARPSAEAAARGAARVPAPRPARDALAQRAARARRRRARPRAAVPALRALAGAALAARRARGRARGRRRHATGTSSRS